MATEKYRSRAHMVLLYPDNAEHCKAIEKIKRSYDYAMILHDRDFWTEEDEKKNPEHVSGLKKKEHWHVVLRFPQAVWSSAICKELGIEHKFIECIKKFDNALMYLIHYNDSDKTLYSIDEVSGNLKNKVVESINKLEKSEGEKVLELIDFIEDYPNKLTIKEFSRWCAMNGYWSEFRRSASVFLKIIDEHNRKISSDEYDEILKEKREKLSEIMKEVKKEQGEFLQVTIDWNDL